MRCYIAPHPTEDGYPDQNFPILDLETEGYPFRHITPLDWMRLSLMRSGEPNKTCKGIDWEVRKSLPLFHQAWESPFPARDTFPCQEGKTSKNSPVQEASPPQPRDTRVAQRHWWGDPNTFSSTERNLEARPGQIPSSSQVASAENSALFNGTK